MYKYEAVVLGGLPEEGLARAGIKVISKVLISAVAQNNFLLKVQDAHQVSILKSQEFIFFSLNVALYFFLAACGPRDL